ncbi:MAG: hypothetical protein ACTSP4_16670 [Candidatus Hodarchaeales archaeon]
MGNFKQHFDWAQGFLIIGLVFIIFLLTAYSKSPIVEWLGENAKIFAPFFLGTGIGAVAYVTVGKVFNDMFSYDIGPVRMAIVAIISAVIGYGITYAIVWSPWWKKLNSHWGMWHSITAGLLVSGILGIFFFYTWRALWGFILGIAFFLGYLTHLVCDQFYHDIRDKEWAEGNPRYAFKTLRNSWSWDPLILFVKYGPVQILGEYLSKDGEGVATVFNHKKKKD